MNTSSKKQPERRDVRLLSSELPWPITKEMIENSPYQLMPKQKPEEREALRQDILKNGIESPPVFDEQGYPLDGHTRLSIYLEELEHVPDFDCLVKYGLSEQEKRDYVRTRNSGRRHLNQNQRRAMCADQLKEVSHYSNRRIGNIVGLDHHVVGEVRRQLVESGDISDLDETEGEDGRKRGKRHRSPDIDAPQVEELVEGDCRLLAGTLDDVRRTLGPGSVRVLLCDAPAVKQQCKDVAGLAEHVLRPDGLFVVPVDTRDVAPVVTAMTPKLTCVDTMCCVPPGADLDANGYTFAAALSLVFATKLQGDDGSAPAPLFSDPDEKVLFINPPPEHIGEYVAAGRIVLAAYPAGTDLEAEARSIAEAAQAKGKPRRGRPPGSRNKKTTVPKQKIPRAKGARRKTASGA